MTKDELRKIIGANIRNERVARNLSIDELAELIGRTPGFVGLIERGRRGATALTLFNLAEKLDLTVDRFFRADGEVVSLALNEENPMSLKRTKLNAIISDLNEFELDFMIAMVKGLKTMSNAINGRVVVEGDDEDDEDDE